MERIGEVAPIQPSILFRSSFSAKAKTVGSGCVPHCPVPYQTAQSNGTQPVFAQIFAQFRGVLSVRNISSVRIHPSTSFVQNGLPKDSPPLDVSSAASLQSAVSARVAASNAPGGTVELGATEPPFHKKLADDFPKF